MTPTEMLKILLQVMGWLFLVFYAYQFVYVLVPFFVKKGSVTRKTRFAPRDSRACRAFSPKYSRVLQTNVCILSPLFSRSISCGGKKM